MDIRKTEKIVKRLEHQLRNTSRQLVNFKTEEETLQYLSDSFRLELSGDFVGIIMKESEKFCLKVWSGESISLTTAFPMEINQCSPSLMEKTITFARADEDCEITAILKKEKVPTWFTFPLKNELNLFGFCIIGFFQDVTLYPEMGKVFDEFGKDVAIAMLYQNEKNHKQNLHLLLNYQQELLKETVVGNGLDGITDKLGELFSKSVLILDRFLRPISFKLMNLDKDLFDELVELAAYEVTDVLSKSNETKPDQLVDRKMAVWPINGGGDLLAYLAVDVTNEKMDEYHRLSIDVARNIYSIQFIKQKLVLDTKEQVKDSFINQLLVEKIIDEDKIIQYANLFHWDIYRSNCVAVVFIVVGDKEQSMNLLEQEAHKSWLWEQLKSQILLTDPEILIANKEGEYILISPAHKSSKAYWSKVYENFKKTVETNSNNSKVFLAAGGKTTKLSEYYDSYLQAVKALNVVMHRYKDIGFALFDELGAYTLLQQLKDEQMAKIFVNKHLQPLLQYSEGKTMDLFHTLQVYLYHNGNIKETSEELYIHRSTLLYRLEKIESLIEVDLNYSEHRFVLMMAYKLYDLFYEKGVSFS
ncbi:PucR family transcriptional regulator [Bacillus dakarensis]|uniref:PucR family transcriptional regulator n=1 Tax=Robertmurraya dakarensis TaxID=1926278 RepID=UPI000981A1CB|nr:helix-turn-helix domain-containing protein [Bacillus dakarensis]